ncbi:MAG: DegT/DnrJ/EryC1/StrS family aminotransferase [Candidatus Portnoybacteria bacterium]|nr:DegT/DnrJ/EryC1/StrS family aminotransferase [Candidatus Portnoybacteria bacterium]MDD4982483.1 DegT/DnrJ/EryC1/StrS family aminotransferase [Candidatus Portnoybacteria bacterium]
MRFFSKLPRAKAYLKLSELLMIFLKILSTKLQAGEKTIAWEAAFSERLGSTGALCLSRARLALFFLLKNLGLPAGSEIIMTPLTIADMVNAVRWAKLKPVFCDLGVNTYNIDYRMLRQLITPRTRILFITHLNGLATDMDEIMAIARQHSLIVIEDASQALGAAFKGKTLGTFGLAGIFSLSFMKTCCTLFGGMIISDDRELLKKIRQETRNFPAPGRVSLLKETIRNIIIYLATNRFVFSLGTYYFIKFSGRLVAKFIKSNPPAELTDEPPKKLLCSYTDCQAELGLKILKRLSAEDGQRIKNVEALTAALSGEAKKYLPLILPETKNVFWRLPFQTNDPINFQKYLLKNYIDSASTNLIVATEEEAFKEYAGQPAPNAQLAHQTIFLPVHSSFSANDMRFLARILNNYTGQNRA